MGPRFGIAWEDPIGNILSSFAAGRHAHGDTQKGEQTSHPKPTVLEAQHEVQGLIEACDQNSEHSLTSLEPKALNLKPCSKR